MIQTLSAAPSALLVTVKATRSRGCEPDRPPRERDSPSRTCRAGTANRATSHSRTKVDLLENDWAVVTTFVEVVSAERM